MPKIRMASMTSIVMTGRRTNCAAMFMRGSAASYGTAAVSRAARGADRHPGYGCQPQLPGRDHRIAGRQPRRDDRFVAFRPRDLHVAQRDGLVWRHDEYVLAVRSVLHRIRRRDDGVLLHRERQHDVDELAGPQRLVDVRELRLELDRPGRDVRRIVDERQLAGCRITTAGRLGSHVQLAVCLIASYVGKNRLGYRE